MRLLSSDLYNGSITSMISSLKNDVNDCTSLTNALDDFINTITSKESLDGIGYQAIKGKLEEYKNLINIRKTLAMELSSAISSAVNKMKSYISPYDELDDSKLSELKQSVSQSMAAIDRLSDEGKNKKGILTSDILGQIENLREKINSLNELIDRIEGLSSADSSAFSAISGSESSIANLNSSVASINSIQFNSNI